MILERIQNRIRSSQAGFSIVEMMIVFAIVGVAMIPLASVQFKSRHQITEAERQSQAAQIAQARLERIKMGGFNSAAIDTVQQGVFTLTSSAQLDAVNPFLREINVQVTWEYNGGPRVVTLAAKQSSR
jgi:prepilin-type N-terminal cleavage/methylation domain-containing protein